MMTSTLTAGYNNINHILHNHQPAHHYSNFTKTADMDTKINFITMVSVMKLLCITNHTHTQTQSNTFMCLIKIKSHFKHSIQLKLHIVAIVFCRLAISSGSRKFKKDFFVPPT